MNPPDYLLFLDDGFAALFLSAVCLKKWRHCLPPVRSFRPSPRRLEAGVDNSMMFL